MDEFAYQAGYKAAAERMTFHLKRSLLQLYEAQAITLKNVIDLIDDVEKVMIEKKEKVQL